jgi:hypothetical protein
MVSVDVHHDAGGCRTSLLCIRALKQPRSTRALSQAQGNDPIDEGSRQSSSKNNDRSVFKYCFLKCLQFKKRTSVSGCPSSFTLDACQTYIPLRRSATSGAATPRRCVAAPRACSRSALRPRPAPLLMLHLHGWPSDRSAHGGPNASVTWPQQTAMARRSPATAAARAPARTLARARPRRAITCTTAHPVKAGNQAAGG